MQLQLRKKHTLFIAHMSRDKIGKSAQALSWLKCTVSAGKRAQLRMLG
jgi:hypothetical protein